jgi:hypothetical protein
MPENAGKKKHIFDSPQVEVVATCRFAEAVKLHD